MFNYLGNVSSLRIKGVISRSMRCFSKIFNFKQSYPELYSHVHPDSRLLFEKPWIGSKQAIKWVCPNGPDHIWDAELGNKIKSFKRSQKCRKVSVTNCLANKYPEIAQEWCNDRNGELTPKDITYGSDKMVWWQCPKNSEHIYQLTPNDRTYSHSGCPYCANQKLCSTNSLTTLYPSLATQWNVEKNGTLTPNDIMPSYSGKVWWRCDENPEHEWECPVNLRVRLHWGCPFCSHRRFEDLSLSALYPEMAKDWDYAKNGIDIEPTSISPNSEKVVWWKCEHGVEWKQSIVYRKKSFLNGYHRCILCKQRLQHEMKTNIEVVIDDQN